jgi:hypothetical protein
MEKYWYVIGGIVALGAIYYFWLQSQKSGFLPYYPTSLVDHNAFAAAPGRNFVRRMGTLPQVYREDMTVQSIRDLDNLKNIYTLGRPSDVYQVQMFGDIISASKPGQQFDDMTPILGQRLAESNLIDYRLENVAPTATQAEIEALAVK